MTVDVQQYVRDVVLTVRNHPAVQNGASPHATIALSLAARYPILYSQIFADVLCRMRSLLLGLNFVTPDSVIAMARACLIHRMVVDPVHKYSVRNAVTLSSPTAVQEEQVIEEALQIAPAPI